ncbi:hypothetical protein B0J14DRAFT_690439 [Halenospora varia]|nr:hypothetical protein B0J14DRAFT_690439 [Halenospora varia]
MASALAIALQALSVALAAAVTTVPLPACTCTQIVSPDGRSGPLECPIVEGQDCGLGTSTRALPLSTTAPALPPVPETPSSAECNNGGRTTLPKYVSIKDTYNRVAASKAIPLFCQDRKYALIRYS